MFMKYNQYCGLVTPSVAVFDYKPFVIPSYHLGDPIKIKTYRDHALRPPRHFEVRMENSPSNPLTILEPSHVAVTIKDRRVGKFNNSSLTSRVGGINFP